MTRLPHHTPPCSVGGDLLDSPVRRLLCGQPIADAPTPFLHWGATHWPLLAVVLAGIVVLRLSWAVWRRQGWQRHATRACWLEIVPPVTATPAATVGLWRLLATLLPVPRWYSVRPARLVWEVAATPSGMRCGLWVPPGVNPTAVSRVVQRGWPGARVDHRSTPMVARGRLAVAVALRATVPQWQQLLDDEPARWRGRSGGVPVEEEDRLRAVYGGLAAAGRTGGGLLQVIVGRAPRRRVAALRRATVNPRRAGPSRGASRAAGLLADVLRGCVLAVLDVVTPGPPARVTHPRGTDPYLAEATRHARAKYAAAPHFMVAVHATAVGPTVAAARAAAADITSGYGLLSPYLRRRRLHRPHATANSRWAAEAHMMTATVIEVAAYAGLPTEPAAYGLPAAASRRRAASRDTWYAAPDSGGDRKTCDEAPSPGSADRQSALWTLP